MATSGGRTALGRLPGEPKKPFSGTSGISLAAGTVLTKLQVAHVKQLMGKASWPVFLDLSPPCYNLEDDFFLTNCSNVVKGLNLSGNSLMELASLAHLGKLRLLYADRNVISSVTFRGLVELELLSLKQNRMETLNDMSDLKKLVNLDLSHNRLGAGFEELSKLRALRVLDLSQNRIDMPLAEFHTFVMPAIRKIPKLEYLSFEGNPIEHAVPEFRSYIINELPKLHYFNWVVVTKDDRNKAVALDLQKTWQAKNNPVGRVPGIALKQSTPSTGEAPHVRRLSSTLDNLLQEIDQLGLNEPEPEAVPADSDATDDLPGESPPPLRQVSREDALAKAKLSMHNSAASDAENQIDKFLEMFDDQTGAKAGAQPAAAAKPANATGAVTVEELETGPAKEPAGAQQQPQEEGKLLDMLQDLIDSSAKPEGAAAAVPSAGTQPQPQEDDRDPLSELESLLAKTQKDTVDATSPGKQQEQQPELAPASPLKKAVAEQQQPDAQSTMSPKKAVVAKVTAEVISSPSLGPRAVTKVPASPPGPQTGSPARTSARAAGMHTSQAVCLSAAGLVSFGEVPMSSSPVPMSLSTAVPVEEPPIPLLPPAGPEPTAPAASAPVSAPQATALVMPGFAEMPSEAPIPPEPAWVLPRAEIRLQKRLGDGALGTTYTATPINGVEVIVKKIRPQRFSTPFLLDFGSEMSRVHSLEHCNLARVMGGSTDNLVCFVTEYVHGVDLNAFVSKLRRLEGLSLRLTVARGVASGMLHLHRNNILHGSLKPSDIIINDEGIPKIRDYGFCGLKGANLSEGAQFAPEYLALELFTSATIAYTEAADVFSFGVCLWVLYEGCLGNDLLKLPAPQEGRPFVPKFSTGATPTAVATLISRCCAPDASARPRFEEVVRVLSGSDEELTRVAAVTVTSEERQKMKAVDQRLKELLETQSDVGPLRALQGITITIAKSEPNVRALIEDGVLVSLIHCFNSPYDVVVENALRALVALSTHSVLVSEYGKQRGAFDKLVECMAHPSDVVSMFALRAVSALMKSTENREMIAKKGMDALIQAMQSLNDFILTSSVLVAARMLKSPTTHEEFYQKGGLSILLSLLDKSNPGLTLHVIESLSSLLTYEPAQGLIVASGVVSKLQIMLASKSDLQQLTALKCVAKFAQCENFLEMVNPHEWIEGVGRLFINPANVKLHYRAFQAITFFAHDADTCNQIEGQGVLKNAVSAMLNKLDNEKLHLHSLKLLEKVLVYDTCRDTFRAIGGLPALAELFRKSSNNAVVQRHCLDVFVIVSSDSSLLDTIADTGVGASFSSQLVAARHRGDAALVLTLLRLVCSIAHTRDGHVAKQIMRAGGMENLIEILVDPRSDTELVRLSSAALIAFASSGEDYVAALSTAGGFEPIFALLSKQQFVEVTLREIVQCASNKSMAQAMAKYGAFLRIATRITSDSPVIQTLALKTILLVSQSYAGAVEALWEAGVPAQLKSAAASTPNRVIASTCTKALDFFS
eukprot:m51a1_g2996 putative leucine-rich repeat-containing protein (1494) ;mRNA; r:756253-761961